MIPTSQQVYDDVRSLLEDVLVPGGERFTNPLLRPFLQTAWSEIHSAALAHDLPVIRRTVYHILPAYTGDLYPSVAGIAHMGEPISVAERSYEAANSVAITGCSTPSSAGICTVTCAGGHPFSTGQRITHSAILGLSDDINDLWMIEGIGPTTYYVRGSTATGIYTSGGVATYSAEEFAKLAGPVDDTRFGATTSASGSLGLWKWARDRFVFPGSTTARQLQLVFRLSDSLPATDNIPLGVDGALSFLKFRTAALAFKPTAPVTAQLWNVEALGSTESTADLGGLLGALMRPQIRTGQRLVFSRKPYRPRRMVGNIGLSGV